MARLIDAQLAQRIADVELSHDDAGTVQWVLSHVPTANTVELPCKIGDWVWAIRSYHGHKHPQRGIVSDMYFSQDMVLHIVVKHIARGEWGKTVFATDKEAYAAIEGRSSNDCN